MHRGWTLFYSYWNNCHRRRASQRSERMVLAKHTQSSGGKTESTRKGVMPHRTVLLGGRLLLESIRHGLGTARRALERDPMVDFVDSEPCWRHRKPPQERLVYLVLGLHRGRLLRNRIRHRTYSGRALERRGMGAPGYPESEWD